MGSGFSFPSVSASASMTAPAPRAALNTALKRQIATLEAAALEDLYQYVTTLRTLGATASSRQDSAWEERAFYDALSSMIAKALKTSSTMPWARFRCTQVYPRFHRAVTSAITTHNSWLPAATKPQTLSMIQLYSSLILSYLRVDEHIIGWKSVCWALENLPVIVDQHFPSYAQAGLLPLIATLRTSQRS